MTAPEWNPQLPWMKFDGSNGQEMATAMTNSSNKDTPEEFWIEVFVNPAYTGSALSLSQTFPNTDQIGVDRWRVPVGYWLNTQTGEVRNDEGVVQDWEDLVAMG